MRGGMTMVGDMFNSRLQSTVSGLCSELSGLLGSEQVFQPPPASSGGGFNQGMASGNNWWPSDLGQPSSSGGQNDARYAYFPQARRLAISRNGQVSLYDTLDHNIGGVQQQQGGSYGSLSFSSQFGTFGVDSLPLINPAPEQRQPAQQQPQQPEPQSYSYSSGPFAPDQQAPASNSYGGNSYASNPSGPYSSSGNSSSGSSSSSDVIGAIERLGQLRERGILTDAEFNAKKAELLSRL
jgi:hypothetical protein